MLQDTCKQSLKTWRRLHAYQINKSKYMKQVPVLYGYLFLFYVKVIDYFRKVLRNLFDFILKGIEDLLM